MSFSGQSISRRTVAGLLVLGLFALSAQPVLAQGRAVELHGLNGGKLTEAALQSGVSIVVVWASWSPRCRDIVDRLNALDGRWGAQASVVSVNFQEERPAIEQFLAGQNLKVPVFIDGRGAFAKQYAVTTLPGLLIYKDGEVAYRGKLPNDTDALIGRILG
jgi:thiol-disulfide isomerase/thioredoxin